MNGDIIDVDDGRHTAKVSHKVIEDALKQCTYTLEIAETNPGDRGNYVLQVMNEYGECSTNVGIIYSSQDQIKCFLLIQCLI